MFRNIVAFSPVSIAKAIKLSYKISPSCSIDRNQAKLKLKLAWKFTGAQENHHKSQTRSTLLPQGKPFGISSDMISKCHIGLQKKTWKYYAGNFNQKGFTGALNYYRALDLNWDLTAAWTGAQVKVPVKFIVGDLDMIYTTRGPKSMCTVGGFKRDVPLLEEPLIMVGVGHFINQERAEEINHHIHEFVRKF